jgi:hypothetical protein
VSDAPTPESTPDPSAAVPGPAQEVEVDLAAFLPEGVVLGEPADEAFEVDVLEAVVATDDGVVVVDEVVVTAPGGTVVADEVVVEEVVVDGVAEEQATPAVDLEALSQIERDLDAVDAAIAALDAGTYGVDASTGRPIDDALLAEDPTRLR